MYFLPSVDDNLASETRSNVGVIERQTDVAGFESLESFLVVDELRPHVLLGLK